MAWTRSEPQWDKETVQPDNRQNDGARFERQLRQNLFEQPRQSGGRAKGHSGGFSTEEENPWS